MTLTNQPIRLISRPSQLGSVALPLRLAASVLIQTLRAFSAPRVINAENELAKTLRREAARQATDKLFR